MILKKIRIVFSALLMLLGVIHIYFTGRFYPTINIEAVWFIGAGIALIYLGLLNLQDTPPHLRGFAWLILAANLIGLRYVILIASKIPQPQAYVGVLFTAVLTVCAALEIKRKS